MPTITLPDDFDPESVAPGDTIEVDGSAVDVAKGEPFVYMPSDAFGSRLGRENKNAIKALGFDPDDFIDEDGNYDATLLDADTAYERLSARNGVELREDGLPKGALRDDELKELRSKASRVDAVEQELETYKEREQKMRTQELHQTAMQYADGLQEGAKEDFLAAIERRVTFDDDDGWVGADEDGNVAFDGGPPVSIESVVNDVRENKSYFFRNGGANDGPDSTPGRSGSGGSSSPTISASEYEERKKKAMKSGDLDAMAELQEMQAEGRVLDN